MRQFGGMNVEVFSWKAEGHTVNPRAVEVMQEIGIDISRPSSAPPTPELLAEFEYAIMCGENTDLHCPPVPPHVKRLHWSFSNPAGASRTEDEVLAEYRRVRDEIATHIRTFLMELGIDTPSHPEDEEPYRPIDCSLHDRLLAWATLHRPVLLEYREAEGGRACARGVIVDVFTRGGEEYLRLQSGETIRLDRVLRITEADDEQGLPKG